MFEKKLKKIQNALRGENLDGLVLGNFGFNVYDDLLHYLLLRVPEHLLAFIPERGKPVFYTIPFEVRELQRRYPAGRFRPMNGPLTALLKPHLQGRKRLGLRPNTLPANIYQALTNARPMRWKSLHQAEKIMAVKLPGEIKALHQAALITDKIFRSLIRRWRQFHTETDAARHIVLECARHGVGPSFPPIVAAGRQAANPHYQPRNKKIQKGFCVLDFGVRFGGYCSDMTRTIYVGRPGAGERALYKKVLQAQIETVRRVKAGVNTAELDDFCRARLGPELNKLFIHGLGHGLGTQVHEWPSVSKGQNVTLEENMVITIEPGVYKNNAYGIRIEDDVVVKKSGPKILTKSKKTLISIN